MADPRASFNNNNKIKRVDLSDDLQLDLKKYLLTEEDRKKLDGLSGGGSGGTSVLHPLHIDLGGVEYKFDGSKETRISLSPETIGASRIDHKHDERYSTKDHKHNYAGSSSPGGAAVSAEKLVNPIKIKLAGAVDGEVVTDLSRDVTINTTVSAHEHNYAGSESPGGPANSALKLTAPVEIALDGAVKGSVQFDGSEKVSIRTVANHEHHEYSTIDHGHDYRYSKLGHEHYYAGSEQPSGPAFYANRFTEPVQINIKGAEVGSFLLTGDEKVIDVELQVNHTHEGTGEIPESLKNPYPIVLSYNGEDPIEYYGDKRVDYSIKPSQLTFNTRADFPAEGDKYITYIDLSNNFSYRWDEATKGYMNIACPPTHYTVIDGNLN